MAFPDPTRIGKFLRKGRTVLGEVLQAGAFWVRFPPNSRRGILEWIKTAKTSASRVERICLTAERAGENRKANFPEGRDWGPS